MDFIISLLLRKSLLFQQNWAYSTKLIYDVLAKREAFPLSELLLITSPQAVHCHMWPCPHIRGMQMKWWLEQWVKTIQEGAFSSCTQPASPPFVLVDEAGKWVWVVPRELLPSTPLPERQPSGRKSGLILMRDHILSSFEAKSFLFFVTELSHLNLNYFLFRQVQSLLFHRMIFEAKQQKFKKTKPLIIK